MQDVMTRLIDVPMARMLVLAGAIFLLVAVLGRVEGKIEPGNIGRVGATIIGILLVAAGLAMHFIEGDALRDRLRESRLPAATAAPARDAIATARVPAKAPDGTAATPGGPAATIKVVSGTWGRNCNAKSGNATAALAQACDGRAQCEYGINPATLEDPAPKCEKDYAAEWKCGAGANVYTVAVPAAAVRGEPLRLACTPR